MITDTEALTRQLLEMLKARNAEIGAELAMNLDTIAQLERQLHLEPSQFSPTPMIVSAPEKGAKTAAPAPSSLAFQRNIFFGLTQRAAAIKLLRLTGQPMKINDILTALGRSDFHFKAKNPYRILWKTLSESEEIQKQGSLFGLKEWKNGRSQFVSPTALNDTTQTRTPDAESESQPNEAAEE
jgi:hypothetical protein